VICVKLIPHILNNDINICLHCHLPPISTLGKMRQMKSVRAFSWWMSHGSIHLTQLKQKGADWWSPISQWEMPAQCSEARQRPSSISGLWCHVPPLLTHTVIIPWLWSPPAIWLHKSFVTQISMKYFGLYCNTSCHRMQNP
jgi:hypothetical protein